MLAQLIGEAGDVAIQREPFQVRVAVGIDGAILVFVDAELVDARGIAPIPPVRQFNLFVYLGDQHAAFNRGAQRGNQQTMITPSGRSNYGTGSVPTQPIRHQPFMVQPCLYIGADIPAKREVPGVGSRWIR